MLQVFYEFSRTTLYQDTMKLTDNTEIFAFYFETDRKTSNGERQVVRTEQTRISGGWKYKTDYCAGKLDTGPIVYFQ